MKRKYFIIVILIIATILIGIGIIKYTDNFFSYVDSDGVTDYREIEIFYFEKEISQQDFEEELPSFGDGPCILEDIKKINAHLYVCVTGYECV